MLNSNLALLLAPLLLCAPLPVLAAQAASLQQMMEAGLRSEGLVGAVWSAVTPQGTTLGAAGWADSRSKAPMRETHRVQVGSVTKTLIAAGILRLVTQGRLDLDAPVAAVLPDVSIENPFAERPLLVRHLMDHTSGLDDARLWQLFSDEPRDGSSLDAGFESRRLRLVLRRPPGEHFSYSNTGFGLLGLIIERVVGQRYEEHLDAELLRPLGMASSTFRFVTQVGEGADSAFAMGHFENGVHAPAVPSFLRPAMQFTTTAEDVARFARFLMSDGQVDDAVFIEPSLLRSMGAPATTAAARVGLRIGYGLGLATRERYRAVGRCHGGNTVGYRAMLCVYPDEQKAFFISMNADNEDANYARLDSLVIASLPLRMIEPTAPSPMQVEPRRWAGIYVPSPARFETFAYADVMLGFTKVSSHDSGLTLQPFMGSVDTLVESGGRLMRSTRRSLPSHALLSPEEAKLAISDGMRTLERIRLWKIAPLWVSLAAGVGGLLYVTIVGLYRVARRRLRLADPLLPAFAAMALLLAAALMIGRQSLLLLGAMTPANVALAVASGLLPLAAVAGLVQAVRSARAGRRSIADAVALVCLLQWCVVLAFWNLVPLRLWI